MKFKYTHPEPREGDIVGPRYWRSLEEVAETPEFKQWLEREFPEGASEMEGVDRRHFLKVMAASLGLAGLGLAGCRQPEKHLMPYAKQPEHVIPGVPLYYSTSMPGSEGYMPVIVETHQARPTKIEGNPSYKGYNGATDIFTQASILDLYDVDRLQESVEVGGKVLKREEVVGYLGRIASEMGSRGGEGYYFLADVDDSPTRRRLVRVLKEKYPKMVWAEYEPISLLGQEKALEAYTGKRVRAVYNFGKVRRVVSFDGDFLDREANNVGNARGFGEKRRVLNSGEVDGMNRLYVIESDYSLTGAKADHRLRVGTSHMGGVIALFAATLMEVMGVHKELALGLKAKAAGISIDSKWMEECVRDLVDNGGESVVYGGSHLGYEAHVLIAWMNELLGARGKGVSYVLKREGSGEKGIKEVAEALGAGKVNTLFVLGGNPVYNAPVDLNWGEMQGKAARVVRLGYHRDETAKRAHVMVALNHYLESWGDGLTYDGYYVPVQPMVMPLFSGFSEIEVLGALSGMEGVDGYVLVKETFNELIGGGNFDGWLAEGVSKESLYKEEGIVIGEEGVRKLVVSWAAKFEELRKDYLEVRYLPSSHVWDGRYANNGWLQEYPDPMTKLSWDNAICISPRLAKELSAASGISLLPKPTVLNELGQANIRANEFEIGKEKAHIGELVINGRRVRGPIHVEPGLANYTVVVALGYGRLFEGGIGNEVGFDVYKVRESDGMGVKVGAQLTVTEERYLLANSQEHWSMEGRAIVREASVETYKEEPEFVKKMGMEAHTPSIYGKDEKLPLSLKSTFIPRGESLYKTPDFAGEQQWGMVVDLNTCTGCNACVIACQSENNIPIVGKDQVLRGREMHWIRLDRYYSGTNGTTELPEDPQVSFMSMACQHCELAPCEMVCPVNATVHDEEGLNVMAYNRCVGTRYCANNCPFKVRRFNFFDWNKRKIGHFYEGPMGPGGVPELQKMQKNPDVSVRMRGVMEKCTYCVQRIEEAKINQRVHVAKDSGAVKVPDMVIKTACQQVCPTEAIVFGDVADAGSRVSKLKGCDRNYQVLGYLNLRARTSYLGAVRNLNPKMPDYNKHPLSTLEYMKHTGHEKAEHGTVDKVEVTPTA